MRFRFLALFSALILAFGLVGCDDDDDGNGATDMAADRTSDRGSDTPTPDTGTDTPVQDTTPDPTVDPVDDTGFDTGIDTPAVECGDIDYQGQCDGDVVIWCQDDALQSVDCAEMYGAYELDATCVYFDAEFGYWCGLVVGEPCLFQDGDGNPFLEFCDGTNSGCVISSDGSTACTESVGPCTLDMEDNANEVCIGNLLVDFCNLNQPHGPDCATFGGTCDATAAACIGVTDGNLCDGDTTTSTDDSRLICGAGLTCNDLTETSYGTCGS